jgi:hypothetical protein
VPKKNEKNHGVSIREISFFGLQAILPALFAILPSAVFLIAFADLAKGVARLADGTLVLIAFTMLISLSQDLTQAVRPNNRQHVARLEVVLRVSAIGILATYMFLQTITTVIDLRQSPQPYVPDPTRGTNSFYYSIDAWWGGDGPVQLACALMAILCLVVSTLLTARIHKVLRPHFVD